MDVRREYFGHKHRDAYAPEIGRRDMWLVYGSNDKT